MMTVSRSVFFKALAVLLSSFLLACSFPLPPALHVMEGASSAWLALIPLILVARLSRPKAAFWWGWLSGFIFWLVSAAWVLELRHTWGYLPVVLLAWVALAAYCALYIGAFTGLLAGVWPERPDVGEVDPHAQWRRLGVVFMAPVIWVGCEYLRGVLFTGFPWNTLGISQYRNIAAIQLASVGGAHAVSGIIVLLNAVLAITALRIVREIRGRVARCRVHVELMIGLGAMAACWLFGVRTVRHGDARVAAAPRVRIAAVQPNTPQLQKWSEEHWREAYRVLQEQTELAMMSRPRLVVWPETAVPDLLTINPVAQAVVASLATEESLLLVGSMDLEQHEADPVYYNSSFLVGKGGHIQGAYRKRHLVPFGEYLPFENQVPLIKRLAPLGFSCRPGGGNGLLALSLAPDATESVPFSALICFEDVFPYLARRDVKSGARFLVNQTNDAWFDRSAASRQHMANAVLRAVENCVPMVRCANTGVTCFIDQFGRIVEMLTRDGARTDFKGFSVAEMRLVTGDAPLTLYTRFGDWLFARPCAMVVLVIVVAGLWRRGRRR